MFFLTIYFLGSKYEFPDPNNSDDSGIVAVGGDLSPERLLSAYNSGIFPWFNENDPIIWWSPNPRFVLFPDKIIVSKSMKKLIKKNCFSITINQCFEKVIKECRSIREKSGTWITNDMITAYTKLHQLGYAHSVEVWQNDLLVGGLYGVKIKNVFCGESMFSNVSNASKTALIFLCEQSSFYNINLIDCQVFSPHLKSMGAENIDRNQFIKYLESGDFYESKK